MAKTAQYCYFCSKTKGSEIMKQRGMVRKLDTLGRVVTPKEFRAVHNIENGDAAEIFNTSQGILIRRYDPVPDVLEKMEEIETVLDGKNLEPDIKEQLQQHMETIKKLLEER